MPPDLWWLFIITQHWSSQHNSSFVKVSRYSRSQVRHHEPGSSAEACWVSQMVGCYKVNEVKASRDTLLNAFHWGETEPVTDSAMLNNQNYWFNIVTTPALYKSLSLYKATYIRSSVVKPNVCSHTRSGECFSYCCLAQGSRNSSYKVCRPLWTTQIMDFHSGFITPC